MIRTQIVNQTRAFLAERGIVVSQGRWQFDKAIPLICAEHWDEFSGDFQAILTDNFAEYGDLTVKIGAIDEQIKARTAKFEPCQRLIKINGIGPLTATALVAHVGDAKQFKNGRQMAAYLGMTPKEYSSGGKQRLLGISKRGSKRIRTLLILGARAAILGLERRKKGEDELPLRLSALDKWLLALKAGSEFLKRQWLWPTKWRGWPGRCSPKKSPSIRQKPVSSRHLYRGIRR